MASLIIFDFDGTLVDTHESIMHSIQRTFAILAPARPPPPASDIQKYVSSGAGLSETLRALSASNGGDQDAFDAEAETRWTAQYREIYASEGQQRIKTFPGAAALLRHLAQRGVPVAIVSNKGVSAVVAALERHGLDEHVPRELIVGDSTPGATRKPDTSSYDNVLLPALKAKYGLEAVDVSKVVEVGDTAADIQFARNIGAKSCWCRFGYGDAEVCEGLKPDYVVDNLEQVIAICDGL